MSTNLADPTTKTPRGPATPPRELRSPHRAARPRQGLDGPLRGAGYDDARRLLSPDGPARATRPGAEGTATDAARQEVRAQIGVGDPILLVTVPAATIARKIARRELSPDGLRVLQEMLERADPAHADAVRTLLHGYAVAVELVGGPDLTLAGHALAKRMGLIVAFCDSDAHLAASAGDPATTARIQAFEQRARVHARSLEAATASAATLLNRSRLVAALYEEYVDLSGQALAAQGRQAARHAFALRFLTGLRGALKTATSRLASMSFGPQGSVVASVSLDVLQELAEQVILEGEVNPAELLNTAVVSAACGVASGRLKGARQALIKAGVPAAAADLLPRLVSQGKGPVVRYLNELVARGELERAGMEQVMAIADMPD